MNVLSLFLLRHGEPEDTRMFYGHLDVALSERGRAQVEGQVEYFRGMALDEVHASDLQRAAIGARAIAAEHGLPVRGSESLREMHLGALEGLTHATGRANFPELAARSYLDMYDFRMTGGGESVADLAARVVPYVERVARDRLAREAPGKVVFYAHNTVVRVLLGLAAGCGARGYGRFKQDYGAINRVDLDSSRCGADLWQGATIVFTNHRAR